MSPTKERIIELLKADIADPMWANHAETSKELLRQAVLWLEIGQTAFNTYENYLFSNRTCWGIWLDFEHEHGLKCQLGPPHSIDQFQNRYTSLCIGGPKTEGAPYPACSDFPSVKAAFDQYLQSLLVWLKGRTHIVWRCYPMLTEDVEGLKEGKIQVFSRLTAYTEDELACARTSLS